MGITLFSFQALFGPLQRIASWFAPASASREDVRAAVVGSAARRVQPAVLPLVRNCHERPGRALRVVRVLERGHCATGAGRMVICGRMADVCAELDRLAALEAAAG